MPPLKGANRCQLASILVRPFAPHSMSTTAVEVQVIRISLSSRDSLLSIHQALTNLHVLLRAKYWRQLQADESFPSCVVPGATASTRLNSIIDLKVDIDRLVMRSLAISAHDNVSKAFLKAAYLVASYATGFEMDARTNETFIEQAQAGDSAIVAGFALKIIERVGTNTGLDVLANTCREVQIIGESFDKLVPPAALPNFF